jgi:hypothetical protein
MRSRKRPTFGMCGQRVNPLSVGLAVQGLGHLAGFGWRGRDRGVGQSPVVAASYCSTTLAGMRPRPLTAMPWSLAHARMSPLC